jgi:DNA-binding LytR/AlgR family response regulator
MPKQSGLDFYKSLKNAPAVIFTTAYPQFAVDAFDLTAVDYLLKPIAFERFLNAVNKAYQQLINFENEVSNSILVKSNKVLHQINLSDIHVIEAFGDYVKIHTQTKTIVTNSTLTNFLNELTASNFIRCHKSFAVNKNLVNVVEGNTIYIKTQQIPVGQKYKASFLEHLK